MENYYCIKNMVGECVEVDILICPFLPEFPKNRLVEVNSGRNQLAPSPFIAAGTPYYCGRFELLVHGHGFGVAYFEVRITK